MKLVTKDKILKTNKENYIKMMVFNDSDDLL